MSKKPKESFTKHYDVQLVLQKLLSGSSFGVFIDDTGSPGDPNTPAGLHPYRKSWVAVVLSPAQVHTVATELNEAVEALRSDLGVTEFHFVEIYSGKGPFREVSLKERIIIFQMFANLFYIHELPIYVQTFDPETHGALAAGLPQIPKIASCFDLHCHEDAALWVLLVRVRDHILAQRTTNDLRAMVFIDEGLKKSASIVEVDVLDDVFLDGLLYFAASSTSPLLQLADFAAFCLNRSQIIARKDRRSDFDIAFLRVLQPMVREYRNCMQKLLWPDKEGPMIS